MPYAADTQIAGLDAAAALTGAELLPMSQGGAAVQDDLGAVRTFFELRQAAGARALAQLAGEEGLFIDFLARSAAIRDFGQAKNFLGRPEDLLTVARADAGYYVDRDRVRKSAGAGVLRYGHDIITGAPLGVLVEGSRTNLLTHSRELGNAAWDKTNATITDNQSAASDGSVALDRIVTSGTSFPRVIASGLSLTAGTPYTLTFEVRAGNVNFLHGTANIAGNAELQRFFGRMDTGVTALSAAVGAITMSAHMVDLGGGLWRMEVTFTPATTGSWDVFFGPSSSMSSTTAVVADYIDAGDVGLEVGLVASSTIDTAGGTASRAADAISIPYALLPASVGGNEATLFAEVDFPDYAVAVTKAMLSLEVSAAERISLQMNSTPLFEGQIVSTADTLGGHAPTIVTRLTKAAVAARANNAANSVNGSGGTTVDTGVTMPVGAYLNLRIGNAITVNHPFGYIRKIAYFPRRMTAAEIDALTA